MNPRFASLFKQIGSAWKFSMLLKIFVLVNGYHRKFTGNSNKLRCIRKTGGKCQHGIQTFFQSANGFIPGNLVIIRGQIPIQLPINALIGRIYCL